MGFENKSAKEPSMPMYELTFFLAMRDWRI
jgi:hypothetical protein